MDRMVGPTISHTCLRKIRLRKNVLGRTEIEAIDRRLAGPRPPKAVMRLAGPWPLNRHEAGWAMASTQLTDMRLPNRAA